jgi:hypothetical protein
MFIDRGQLDFFPLPMCGWRASFRFVVRSSHNGVLLFLDRFGVWQGSEADAARYPCGSDAWRAGESMRAPGAVCVIQVS